MPDRNTNSKCFEKDAMYSQEKADHKTLQSFDIDFGGDTTLPPPPTLTAEQEKRLWRKVDVRLLPILTLMFLASYLDRGEV